MKYNVGDKIKIRNDLIIDEWYGGNTLIEDMSEHLGEIATIKDIVGVQYLIDLDKECFCWTEEMFECKIKNTKEEKKMCSSGRLNKGIESNLCQDVYRAVTKANGNIEFNKVQIRNLCFVKFDGNEKIYAFNNPSDKRLKGGTRVCVDTIRGNMDATVVKSIKIQDKYLKDLIYVVVGSSNLELKNVIGVYETEIKKVEVLHTLGE